MNNFVKYTKILLIAILCFSLSLLFVACGEPGEKGDKGDKGDTGAAGVGIVSIAKDSTSGNVDTYKITLSNGNTSTFTVTNGTNGSNGQNGEDGISVTNAQIVDGELILSFSQGNPINLGKVVGDDGEDGADGKDGKDGVGIKGIVLSNEGELTITLTDDTPINLGNVKGSDGKSAYQMYKEKYPSYTGDEDQWMSDLVNGKLSTVQVTKYTVTFDSNGGTPVAPQQVEKGEKAIQPDNPTREGYTFLGWYTGKYGDEKWVFSGYPVTEQTTLTAKWQINSYNLMFDSNGGSAVENDVVVYNTNYVLPTPTKDNFVFAGWLIDGVLCEDETIIVKTDLELVAKWAKPTCTITFVTGFDDVVVQPQTINYKQQYILPQPTKTDYQFVGWYDEKGNKIENGISKFAEDLVLTAQWRGLTDMFEFDTTANGIVITKYIGTYADVVVPTIIIEQPVVEISADAFAHNTTVQSIAFDGSFTSFTEKMFAGCTNLQKLTISSVYSGQLYTLFGDSIDSVPSTLVDVEYATNSASINPTMWQSKVANHNISLTLANDVTAIEQDQFFACIGLTNVVVPEGVISIGNGAFYSCLNLATISLPDSLTSLGDEVFCASGLASITIPAKVGYIGHVFKGATRLHTVFFVADTQITSINHEAFLDCNSLENIEIPSGVKSIYDRAFSGCSSLESIEIPSSVTIISYEAFRGCSSLKSVTFGKNSQLELFGNFAFLGCSSLESIEIPFGVTSITRSAFYYCSSLESVTFEENSQLESIGDYAFFSCNSLTRIEIPSVVTSIGENAFRGCSSLTIYCKVPSKPSGWSYDWDGGDCTVYWGIIKLVADTQGINYVITINGASVVSYEGMETSIEILSQIDGYPVTEIKKYAFRGCDSLESVTFEVNSQLTNIGYKAFWGCDNLTSIVIPDSVTTIGNDAFSDCGSLIIYCDKESMPPTWSDYWHCFRPVYWYSKTQPITIGNWWHYVDGVVTKW